MAHAQKYQNILKFVKVISYVTVASCFPDVVYVMNSYSYLKLNNQENPI